MSITKKAVAPRVGAWIETLLIAIPYPAKNVSHPVWVRGLKHATSFTTMVARPVAPRVGAWIETNEAFVNIEGFKIRRTPCGCVD